MKERKNWKDSLLGVSSSLIILKKSIKITTNVVNVPKVVISKFFN
jgi:hypothetical protein